LGLNQAPNRPLTSRTGQPLAPINLVRLAIIPRLAEVSTKVSQRAAPALDGLLKDLFYRIDQSIPAHLRDSSCGTGGVDLRTKERLARIDVADPDHRASTHQPGLDRLTHSTRGPREPRPGALGMQRLQPARALGPVGLHPAELDIPKPARIPKPEPR